MLLILVNFRWSNIIIKRLYFCSGALFIHKVIIHFDRIIGEIML